MKYRINSRTDLHTWVHNVRADVDTDALLEGALVDALLDSDERPAFGADWTEYLNEARVNELLEKALWSVRVTP